MRTDVLGRVVEVVSGQSLDAFFAERDLRAARHDRHRVLRRRRATLDRLAALYAPDPADRHGGAQRRARRSGARRRPTYLLRRRRPRARRPRDYHALHARCCSAAASSTASGCSGRARVDYMARNHLPGGADLERVRAPAVRRDDVRRRRLRPRVLGRDRPRRPRKVAVLAGRVRLGRRRQHRVLGRPASRTIGAMFLTQLLPSSTHPHPPAAAPARPPGARGPVTTGSRRRSTPRPARGSPGPRRSTRRCASGGSTACAAGSTTRAT